MLQVHPLTSHCPTLSAHAEPTSQNVAPSNIFMSSTDCYIQESVNFRAFHMPLSVHHFDLQTLELWLSVKHPSTTNSATYTVLVLTNAGNFWPETTLLLHDGF